YVSDDGGAYTLWQSDTTATSANFTGVDGHTYTFYSAAFDNAGNVQPTPTAAQATTEIAYTVVATTTSVTSSENPSQPGDAVTFPARVAAAHLSNGTPSGTVQFQVDGASIGAPVVLVDGTASLASPALSPGQHTVTALYTPDTDFFASSTGRLAGG